MEVSYVEMRKWRKKLGQVCGIFLEHQPPEKFEFDGFKKYFVKRTSDR